jgi:hypothetical protein
MSSMINGARAYTRRGGSAITAFTALRAKVPPTHFLYSLATAARRRLAEAESRLLRTRKIRGAYLAHAPLRETLM